MPNTPVTFAGEERYKEIVWDVCGRSLGPLARAPSSSGGVNVQVELVAWDDEKLRQELGSRYDFVIADLPVVEDVGFATQIPPEFCSHLLQKTVSETDNEQELVEWRYISASQLCQRERNEANLEYAKMLEMWNSEVQARKCAETSTREWHHKYELSEAFGALLDNFTSDFFKSCRLQFPESVKHFKPLVETPKVLRLSKLKSAI